MLNFISIPYNNVDKEIVEYRVKWSQEFCVKLFIDDITALSPGVIGHYMIKDSNRSDIKSDKSFNIWRKFCLDILSGCDVVYFCLLPGYEYSSGVKSEYEESIKSMKTIFYVDEDFNILEPTFKLEFKC